MNIKFSKLNIIAAATGLLFAIIFVSSIMPQGAEADFDFLELQEKPIIIQGNTLLAISNSSLVQHQDSQKLEVIVTGYSSTVDQTDSDPFITASGSYVKDGIIAANFLPFGAKVRLPEAYGDKVFVVEDRMHPRKKYQVDIWFPSRQEALNFGIKTIEIEVVQEN